MPALGSQAHFAARITVRTVVRDLTSRTLRGKIWLPRPYTVFGHGVYVVSADTMELPPFSSKDNS
jgi:hypothetical protein